MRDFRSITNILFSKVAFITATNICCGGRQAVAYATGRQSSIASIVLEDSGTAIKPTHHLASRVTNSSAMSRKISEEI